jgi:hypothetical protein
VFTVGEVNAADTFPFARFTLTGPAESVGAGPELVTRRFTVNLLTHDHIGGSSPLSTNTVHVYVTPSCSTPAGTVHDPGVEPDIDGELTTCPLTPSLPVVKRNWYLGPVPDPADPVFGSVSVGVRVDTIELLAGATPELLTDPGVSVVNEPLLPVVRIAPYLSWMYAIQLYDVLAANAPRGTWIYGDDVAYPESQVGVDGEPPVVFHTRKR